MASWPLPEGLAFSTGAFAGNLFKVFFFVGCEASLSVAKGSARKYFQQMFTEAGNSGVAGASPTTHAKSEILKLQVSKKLMILSDIPFQELWTSGPTCWNSLCGTEKTYKFSQDEPTRYTLAETMGPESNLGVGIRECRADHPTHGGNTKTKGFPKNSESDQI